MNRPLLSRLRPWTLLMLPLLAALASPPARAAADGDWSARVLRAVNDARQQQSLPPLELAP